MKPRIFISHSAKEPLAREILRAIVDELQADGGFELLVDTERLEGGDLWRAEIYRWLSTCHAAVGVLSTAAVEDSDWVNKELFAARARAEHEPGFKILPVLVPPVTVDELKSKGWEPLALAEVQHLPSGSPAEIARGVREHRSIQALKQRYGSDSPHHAIETHLAAVLRPLDEGVLEIAAMKLGLDLTGWISDRPRAMAQRMLGADLKSLYEAAMELKPLDVGAAIKAFELAAPAWVDWDAASEILRVASEGNPPRAVAINSLMPRTCEMYVRRARFDMPNCSLPRPQSEDVAAELRAAIRATLIEWGYGSHGDSDERLDRNLARDPAAVMILPVEVLDGDMIAAAAERFRHLTLFVPAGPSGRLFLSRYGLDYAVYLEPELTPDLETEALEDYEFACGRLKAGNRPGETNGLREAV